MSIIQNMIETYKLVYPVEKNYPLEIIVTTEIYNERLKLSNTKCDQAIVEASKQELSDCHRLLVLPDEQDSNFYLLLHENLFDEAQLYGQAIAYEYTRLIDFADIQEKYGIKNLRAAQFPDSACFLFLSEARACFRGFNLYYNLTSVENKAVLFSYLCGMVPDYEKVLSRDLPAHMISLAEYYGQALAISAYVNFEVSLPDYLNRHAIHDLLAQLKTNITNVSIFENYEAICETYNDFINNKSKEAHVHTHQCNHDHGEHHHH